MATFIRIYTETTHQGEKQMFRKTLLGLTLTFSLQALAAPVQMADTPQGEILTDTAGMSLYVFDKDTQGVSNCNGQCADNWPPLNATADDQAEGDYGILIRADGSLQWSYKGQPLYLWVKDKMAGDTTGDGVKDIWHLARP
jgi:predicted lipoprotein with Yx(FWY)xxD motif